MRDGCPWQNELAEKPSPRTPRVAILSNGTSPSGLGQGDVAGFVTDEEPMRRIGGGVHRYYHALRRNWRLAIALGLLGGMTTTIPAWLFTSERHTAVAVLRISANERQLVFQTTERATAFDFDIYKGTQQQLLTSEVVLLAALRSPQAAAVASLQSEDDPARWLARSLHVELPPNSEIMRVSLTASQPEDAAILLGAVIDAYMNAVVDTERHRQQERLKDLDRLYGEKEAEMRERRTAPSNSPSNWELATPAPWPSNSKSPCSNTPRPEVMFPASDPTCGGPRMTCKPSKPGSRSWMPCQIPTRIPASRRIRR